MDAIRTAWSGKENLALVFWGYFVLGQIGFGLAMGMIGALSVIYELEFIAIIFAVFMLLPFVIWSTWSVWVCAFNVKWQPWGYAARTIVFLIVITKVYEFVN